MPIIDYPFLQASANTISRPMLIARLSNPHSGLSVDVIGIIDTGADSSAMPATYAELLGHDLKQGVPSKIGTGNGVAYAYSHTSTISIYNTKEILLGNQEPIYTTSEIKIDFMENLHTVLFGVKDFLGQFYLGIDYPRQLFSIRYC